MFSTHVFRDDRASIRVQLHNLRVLLAAPVAVDFQFEAVRFKPSHQKGVVLVVPVSGRGPALAVLALALVTESDDVFAMMVVEVLVFQLLRAGTVEAIDLPRPKS